LNIGDNAVCPPEAGDNPDWMRWNNLGIAYLDQLQYSDAVRAFSEVVKLRPDYSDAYTNIALTEIQWEKYDSARASIMRAVALSPDNARALYYLAQLQRRAGDYDAEVANLKKVVELFPASRDARRDLGLAFYRQHDYPAARIQFEAVQGIDPDDLTAHYNLSIIYRRMEMDQKAAEEQAQFITKKFDPGAPTYSFDFLRQHPEISIESIPQHVHSDLPYEVKPAHAGAQ
jgi:tetratricopeptide (TPR) repeat protein